jgi:hypothetical protein
MPFTGTTLKQAIRDYLQAQDEAAFEANLSVIVKQGEERILKATMLPVFQKNATANTTAGNKYLLAPMDFLAPFHLAMIVGGIYKYLLEKDSSFIQEAYPDPTITGVPRYYTVFNDTSFVLGPAPADVYVAELQYYARPPSIVDTETSWLGTHAEDALLAACLIEGYVFLKGDEDLMKVYEAKFQAALADLQRLGRGLNTRDSFRGGERGVP